MTKYKIGYLIIEYNFYTHIQLLAATSFIFSEK